MRLLKKGLSFYRKSLPYTIQKWHINKNEPTKSGTSADNVIEFARRKMHKHMNDVEVNRRRERVK